MHLIKKTFLFAHRGVEVEEFVASDDPVELTDECAEVAVAEGWAEPFKPAASQKTDPQQAAEADKADQPAAEPKPRAKKGT